MKGKLFQFFPLLPPNSTLSGSTQWQVFFRWLHSSRTVRPRLSFRFYHGAPMLETLPGPPRGRSDPEPGSRNRRLPQAELPAALALPLASAFPLRPPILFLCFSRANLCTPVFPECVVFSGSLPPRMLFPLPGAFPSLFCSLTRNPAHAPCRPWCCHSPLPSPWMVVCSVTLDWAAPRGQGLGPPLGTPGHCTGPGTEQVDRHV